MPGCADCRMLTGSECSAHRIALEVLGRQLPPPPLGACMIPIVEDYTRQITAGMHMLEVGCGSWNALKVHCEKVGAHYEGIDPDSEYFGKETVATRIENLAELSYADETFDRVIGNQTMEHWAEHACSLRWGLYQCFRVCKPNGSVLLNVPFHFHGTKQFMLGRMDTIRELFAPFSSRVTIERWGHPCDPLPECRPRPGVWGLAGRAAYIVDIQAVKDRPLPSGYSNRGASSGRLGMIKNLPWSYLLYVLLQKVRSRVLGEQAGRADPHEDHP